MPPTLPTINKVSAQLLMIVLQLKTNFVCSIFIDDSFCPGTWDGWLCWPDTPAGKSAYAPCPSFVTGFDPNSRYFNHPSDSLCPAALIIPLHGISII